MINKIDCDKAVSARLGIVHVGFAYSVTMSFVRVYYNACILVRVFGCVVV